MDIRNEIVESVVREIVGPSPNPHYLDSDTGEEILLARVHGSPKSRYGAGMLYPQSSINPEESDSNEDQDFAFKNQDGENEGIEESNTEDKSAKELDYEEPVGLANQFLPSAMGFTVRFLGNQKNDLITLYIRSAWYEKGKDKKTVKQITNESKIENVKTKDGDLFSEYWIRRPHKIEPVKINLNSLFKDRLKSNSRPLIKLADKDWLSLQIFNRSTAEDLKLGYYTLTFVLINSITATTDDAINSNHILFQNQLKLSTENHDLIVPYQEKNSATDTIEEKVLALLYRKKRVFAIGHGVSVSWFSLPGKLEEKISSIQTSVIPTFDIPQVAPSGNVELSMLHLSSQNDWSKTVSSLNSLVAEYEKWITEISRLMTSSDLEKYLEAAGENIRKCRLTLSRLKKGIEIVLNSSENSDIRKSFLWMNRAMLWQQQRSKVKQRKWRKTGTEPNATFVLDNIQDNVIDFPSLTDFYQASQYNGRWRPFQLAFILMNIEAIVSPECKDRGIVDLIWFPTGGGKTEAYLGLTAFTIFYRRLRGKKDYTWEFYGGTTVLMRYTLRLLTTQQYERASSLICACDIIRKENSLDLGNEPVSIGLWVGGSSTPNDNSTARTQFNQLTGKGKTNNPPYNFIVMKCPCCGAQIGKLDSPSKKEKVKGLKKEDGAGGRILFQCENNRCEYSNDPLPLYVVDEYIYKNPPTLLLGTVDKFALIPWKTEAGNLFGFREAKEGWKRIHPPELIIQDELHLIAGPLGTMVGLYETMVQTLCNNYQRSTAPFLPAALDSFIPPKIVASSATISRAFEQVKSLYGINSEDKLHIFPSQGLDFGNTWFSEEKSAHELNGDTSFKFPGRKYIGILASGYPSAQTAIVRAYSSVLQKVKELDNESAIDYYWTLLGYFNSIRELGGASSLVFGDIKERLSQIQNRELLVKSNRRYIRRTEELTSRISSFEIPEVLKKLEESHNLGNAKVLDICLATNMVATGVDVSRLGLMFIHGQPKTTAEYIQASSRVGRKVPDGPGLVFTLYSPSKPRDKSQYEQFQGYHARIYSNVEPTSVTPFSIIARERAIHAILFGLVRQFSEGDLRKKPYSNPEFEELHRKIKLIIKQRCSIVDPDEVDNTLRLIDKRVSFWKKGFQSYGDAGNYGILQDPGYVPLFYSNSAEVREEIVLGKRSLATPTSMRGVDNESVVNVYSDNDNDGKE